MSLWFRELSNDEILPKERRNSDTAHFNMPKSQASNNFRGPADSRDTSSIHNGISAANTSL